MGDTDSGSLPGSPGNAPRAHERLQPGGRAAGDIESILVIGAFSAIGIFERSIIRYAIYSALIQFGYFMLDLGTALLIGKSIWFAILQLINFTVAGLLFAIVISILYNQKRKEEMRGYAGFYDKNQFLVLCLSIGALSLGGMPGFNIFVGEYLIYASLFSVHPALMLLSSRALSHSYSISGYATSCSPARSARR